MLFVRTRGLYQTMVRIPILVATMVVAAVVMTTQTSAGSTARDLDLIIYPDGTVHVSAQLDVDPIDADLELDLHGSAIDNFVVVGENGFLLNAGIAAGDTTAVIETFGSSMITVNYDIHDLVSKTGRVWTFSLDAPSGFTLLLPKNSAIVGMTNVPISMELIGPQQQHLLVLPAGATEVDYLLAPQPAVVSPTAPDQAPSPDYLAYGMIGGVAAAAAAAAAALTVTARARREKITAAAARRRSKHAGEPSSLPQSAGPAPPPAATPQKSGSGSTAQTPDIEAILGARPDIRDDDRDIVRFISGNGGQALESELRKKFLQPRTTMWRAVKRLERNGLIEIEKKDMQNLVKLCGDAAATRGEGTQ